MVELIILLLVLFAFIFKKYPFIWLLIICLYNSNVFFGTLTSDMFVYHNLSDTANLLLLVMVLLLSRRRYNNGLCLKKFQKGILLFLSFILVAIFVDVFVNGTPWISQIKAMRNWIPLSIIFVTDKIKVQEVKALFKLIVLCCILYFSIFTFEYVTGIKIVAALRESALDERASSPPFLALLAFPFLLFSHSEINKNLKWTFYVTLLANLVVSGSRSLFITYILIYGIYFVMSRFTILKLIMVVCAFAGILVIFNTDNVLSRRFNDSKSDIADIRKGSNDQSSGNLSFRMLLVEERFHYISNNSQYFIFGMGNIEEKNLKRTIFHIGLYDELGNVVQLDTGDTSWATFFIRWGVCGTILYFVLIYWKFLCYSFKKRNNLYLLSLFVYLLASIITSFTSSNLSNLSFWILPILVLPMSVCIKKYNNVIYENIN